MKIDYYVERGRYNILNPEQESAILGFRILDNQGKILMSCGMSFKVDEYDYLKSIMKDNPIDGFIEASELWFNSILFSTEEDNVRDILKFVNENYVELKISWIEDKLEEINKEIEKLGVKRNQLLRELLELKGVV